MVRDKLQFLRSLRKFETVGAASRLIQSHIATTTCGCLLKIGRLNFWLTLMIRSISEWPMQDQRGKVHGCNLMSHHVFQIFWLTHLIMPAGPEGTETSPSFCEMYTGNFHYRIPFGLHGREMDVSPLELATQDRRALERFKSMLKASHTDIQSFANMEYLKPWCKWDSKNLTRLFEADTDRLTILSGGFSRCVRSRTGFYYKGPMAWSEVVKRFESGQTLDEILIAGFGGNVEFARLHRL